MERFALCMHHGYVLFLLSTGKEWCEFILLDPKTFPVYYFDQFVDDIQLIFLY